MIKRTLTPTTAHYDFGKGIYENEKTPDNPRVNTSLVGKVENEQWITRLKKLEANQLEILKILEKYTPYARLIIEDMIRNIK